MLCRGASSSRRPSSPHISSFQTSTRTTCTSVQSSSLIKPRQINNAFCKEHNNTRTNNLTQFTNFPLLRRTYATKAAAETEDKDKPDLDDIPPTPDATPPKKPEKKRRKDDKKVMVRYQFKNGKEFVLPWDGKAPLDVGSVVIVKYSGVDKETGNLRDASVVPAEFTWQDVLDGRAPAEKRVGGLPFDEAHWLAMAEKYNKEKAEKEAKEKEKKEQEQQTKEGVAGTTKSS